MDVDIEPADSPAEQPRGKRLDSWKEIAAHLNRDVATVRRWEKREGLPVHRHLHEKLGSVFAYTSELEAWGERRLRQPEPVQTLAESSGQTGDRVGDSPEERAPTAGAAHHWRRALPWALTAALAAGLSAVLVVWAPWRRPALSIPLQLEASLGDVSVAPSAAQFGDAFALSSDGSLVVFVGQNGAGQRQLYIRQLDQLNQLKAEPLSGTEDAHSPFFSRDERSIGFFAGGKLKKIALTGGSPVTLADAPAQRGGAWSADDTIIFSPHRREGTRLLRVPLGGGKAEPLTTLVDDEVIHLWPQVLPSGTAVLYTSSSIIGAYDDATIVVQSLLPGGARTVVQRGGYHGRYLPSGHLAFIHDGTLFAAPFDLDTLAVTGQPVRAIEGVNANSATGGAQFALSATGTLMYLPGQTTGGPIPLEWMDRQGAPKPMGMMPANWIAPRFAPDGQRVAMEIRDGSPHVWVYDWAGGRLRRVTADPDFPSDHHPVWTPGGQGLVFGSSRADQVTPNLYLQREDGRDGATRLTHSKNRQQPSSWSPDGKYLAFEETTAETQGDVMILPMKGNDVSGWTAGEPFPFVKSPAMEFDPIFSPRGNWLAYVKLESGRPNVCVRPFPSRGGELVIGAGVNPTWSQDKDELFYGFNGQIMVVDFKEEGASFRPRKSRLWSAARYQTRGSIRMFDLHPDGERVALAPAADTTVEDKLSYVLNFSDELRRIVATTRR